MGRYVLRYTGQAPLPGKDRKTVESAEGIRIIDSSSRMYLVECTPEAVAALRASLDGWIASEETQYQVPGPKLKVKKRG